jgi:hypothetical protein
VIALERKRCDYVEISPDELSWELFVRTRRESSHQSQRECEFEREESSPRDCESARPRVVQFSPLYSPFCAHDFPIFFP